ncbi:MAG: ribonuclease Z [Candidatus Hydrothermarchaeales archaeon]
MELIFLGTTAAVPSSGRNHVSLALRYRDEIILWDCGEGTQRQMIRSKLSYMRVIRIFITHFHGDHFLGLPGLIQTLSFANRQRPLQIFGPPGIKEVVGSLLDLGNFDLGFEVTTRDFSKNFELKTEHYKITPIEVEHSIPTYGLVFEELKGREFLIEKALELGLEPGPAYSRLQEGEHVTIGGRDISPEDVLGEQKQGAKIVYSSDTRPCENVIKNCEGAILIHDSTFDETLREKAIESMHSTCVDACHVAREGKAKQLFLIHISPRYKEDDILYEQARDIFERVVVAEDLMTIEI